MQEDSQSGICVTDVHSEKLGGTKACSSSPRCDGNVCIASSSLCDPDTNVSVSLSHVKHRTQNKLNSAITSPESEDKRQAGEKSDNEVQPLKHQERQMTVDVLAECVSKKITYTCKN